MAVLRDIFPDKPSTELESALRNAETVDEAASSLSQGVDVKDKAQVLGSLKEVLDVKDKAQDPGSLKEALEIAANDLYGSSHCTADKQKLRINVRRKKVWDNTLQIFKSLTKSEFGSPICVRFVGEEAVDLGGPKREFFSILFQSLEQQRIVVGNSSCLTFSHDVIAYDEREYEICGNLVALSLLNGCSGSHNFSSSLVNYILHPDRDFTKCEVEEIPEPEMRSKLMEIAQVCEEREFKDKVLFLEERFDAGFNKASVSLEDKEKLLQALAYHYIISTCHDEITQFKKGLSFGGVLSILQKFPREAVLELTDSRESEP